MKKSGCAVCDRRDNRILRFFLLVGLWALIESVKTFWNVITVEESSIMIAASGALLVLSLILIFVIGYGFVFHDGVSK